MKKILSFICFSLVFQVSFVHATIHTYTLCEDFELGNMNGVDCSVPDQLQLSEEQSVLPFIWIANSGESTVSKINTETGCELGRYRTGPGSGASENPSRTTVDINGDLWVGNRDSHTATKIALVPTDVNNDGFIKTSEDLNNNCKIEPSEVLPWGQDEAVLLRIGVSAGPRAVAVDADNNLWIGGYFGGQVELYDGDTGLKLKSINLGYGCCYGALVDSYGTLWLSGRGLGNKLIRIDNPNGNHSIEYISAPGIYGISIDKDGYIYFASWDLNRLYKYDPVDKHYEYPGGFVSLSSNGRGIAVGLEGDVWIAQSNLDNVVRYDSATGALKAVVPVGYYPTGVAVAADGRIWVTNLYSNNVSIINPLTNTSILNGTKHTRPYNYSDMTGIISRNVTVKKGTWTVLYDEGSPSVCETAVSWNNDLPGDSTIAVTVTSSETGSSWTAPQSVESGEVFLTAVNATYVEIEAEFTASTGEQLSPVLYDLTVSTTPCNLPPIALCEDKVVSANNQCLGYASIDAGSFDPDGPPWSITENPTSPFALGTTNVLLEIMDPFGESDSCSAAVMVVDDTLPTFEVAGMIEIWPPNHRYHAFTLSDCVVPGSVKDNCNSLDANVAGTILSIYSDEPEDDRGNGDGKTVDDIIILGNHEFEVRSERQGKGNGRVYGVNFIITDEAGNSTGGTCLIGVPHDQSGKPLVDDGMQAGYVVEP